MTSSLLSSLPSPQTLERRVMRAYHLATPQDVAAGEHWYADARALCRELASLSGHTVGQVAAAVAHLSPRQQWTTNVRAARALVLTGERYPGILRSCFDRAKAALHSPDPLSTFGRGANKTRNFALNLAGSDDAVTVDTWVARVVGIDDNLPFRSAAAYDAVVRAYRRCAARLGIPAAELQAITWAVTRRVGVSNSRKLAAANRAAA